MNDTYKSFSLRRVGCLLSYSFKEWREWYLYLPLGCLLIGITHLLHSIYVLNPRSVDSGQPYGIVNVSNFMNNAGGFSIVKVFFLVFVFSLMFKKFVRKEGSTFYRSIPTTAFEKMISFFIEIIIMAFLVASMIVLSLLLDGIVCTIYNYNEWTDILPAIKDFFTPELSIVNGQVSFLFSRYMILNESWLSNQWFILGVSLNRSLYTAVFIFLFGYTLIISKNSPRTNIRLFGMTKGLNIVNLIIIIIIVSLLIGLLIFGGDHKNYFHLLLGFGPWCYKYEYGWMIQTTILLLWISLWFYNTYMVIKNGEAR